MRDIGKSIEKTLYTLMVYSQLNDVHQAQVHVVINEKVFQMGATINWKLFQHAPYMLRPFLDIVYRRMAMQLAPFKRVTNLSWEESHVSIISGDRAVRVVIRGDCTILLPSEPGLWNVGTFDALLELMHNPIPMATYVYLSILSLLYFY